MVGPLLHIRDVTTKAGRAGTALTKLMANAYGWRLLGSVVTSVLLYTTDDRESYMVL